MPNILYATKVVVFMPQRMNMEKRIDQAVKNESVLKEDNYNLLSFERLSLTRQKSQINEKIIIFRADKNINLSYIIIFSVRPSILTHFHWRSIYLIAINTLYLIFTHSFTHTIIKSLYIVFKDLVNMVTVIVFVRNKWCRFSLEISYNFLLLMKAYFVWLYFGKVCKNLFLTFTLSYILFTIISADRLCPQNEKFSF